jgi:beta-N-acetylhexosaminidase
MSPPRIRTEHHRLGRLLVIGFDGTEVSPRLAGLLKQVQPSGVILFARNIVHAEQAYRLLEACRSVVGERIFACVDLEGGRVDRLRNVLGPAPSPGEVFRTGDRKLFRKHGAILGECCRALGFNVNLAPVLDLAFPASRAVMSSRSVSDDPRQVVLYAREFLAGLDNAGVLGAGKHFPGLGEGELDSHQDLPVIRKSFAKLWAQDLVPYRVLKRQLPMIVINHASYPAVTRDRRPASLSPYWITQVLRRRLAYRGLIVSDDLEMGGVLKAAPADQAAVEFVSAGGDLCLVCHRQEIVERAFEALVRRAESDPRFRRRALQSVGRIDRFSSRKLGRRAPRLPSRERIRRLTTELWEFTEQVRFEGLSPDNRSGGGR